MENLPHMMAYFPEMITEYTYYILI